MLRANQANAPASRLLRRAFRDQGIALHAFVLLDNHFNLLVTPGAIGTLSSAMGRAGQAYVQAFNLRENPGQSALS